MNRQLSKEKVMNLFGYQNKQKKRNVQKLYKQHRCIMKNAHFATIAYQKLSSSFLNIKNVFKDLQEVYLSPELPSSQLFTPGVKACLEGFINSNGKIREQLQQNSSKLSLLHEMYLNPIKKQFQKYSEARENLEHYQKKIENLKSKNRKDQDHQRIQRNVDKLTNAQDQYKNMASSLQRNIDKVNQEVWKSCVSSFINNIVLMGEANQEMFDGFKTVSQKLKSHDILDKMNSSHELIENIGDTLNNLIKRQGPKKEMKVLSIRNAFKIESNKRDGEIDFFSHQLENSPKQTRGKQFMGFENVYCEQEIKENHKGKKQKLGIKVKNIQYYIKQEFKVKKLQSFPIQSVDQINLLDL